MKNLNVEEELWRAIRPIIGRRRLQRTTRRVIAHYAIAWAAADPSTTDVAVRRAVARNVWPMLEVEDTEARVKTITRQYWPLVERLIRAVLNAMTTNAIMKRVLLDDIVRAERMRASLARPRTLADARFPLLGARTVNAPANSTY